MEILKSDFYEEGDVPLIFVDASIEMITHFLLALLTIWE